MKVQVRKNCTGCHTPAIRCSTASTKRAGTRSSNLMKHVNVLGVLRVPTTRRRQIEFHQKQLAAYLAPARGPGETSMKFNLRPRPSGEAARVVFKEYDFPMEGGHTSHRWTAATGRSARSPA